MEERTMQSERPARTRFDLKAIAAWCIVALTAVIPLAVIPNPASPVLLAKVLVVTMLAAAALIASKIVSFKEKTFSLSKSAIVFSAWLIPATYALAAFFSPSPSLSFLGYELEPDTVLFAVLAALLATLPGAVFRSVQDLVKAYTIFFGAAVVVALFHIARLFFGPDFLSLGVFSSPIASILGSWNDLGIYAGLAVVLALITLIAVPLRSVSKSVLIALIAGLLFILAAVNFFPVWVLVGVIALVIFVYTLIRYVTRHDSRVRPSIAAIAVFLVSVAFVIVTPSLGDSIAASFGVAQIEARPSFGSTLSVGSQVLSNNALIGTGPNHFRLAWDAYHPTDTNLTPFWNVGFSGGFGTIPTAFVTSGIFGGLAWIVFILCFLFFGGRALLRASGGDQRTYVAALLSFVGGAYLLALAFVYLPSTSILMLCFLFIGFFVAALRLSGGIGTISISIAENPRVGFAVVITIIALVVSTVAFLGAVGLRYASTTFFGSAALALSRDDIATAREAVTRANMLGAQDRYYRLLTAIALVELNEIVNTQGEPSEALQAQFRETLARAVEGGLSATAAGRGDYRNWQSLAAVYRAVVPLQISGAYDNAIKAYDEAQKLAPSNPELRFNRAELEIYAQNLAKARTNLAEALTLKADYTDALLLLSRVELTDGQLDEAIARAEAVLVFEPNNFIALYQAALLSLEGGSVEKARSYLERTVAANPDFSDARFYLGNILLGVGDLPRALEQFEQILLRNPDNTAIREAVESLRKGESPAASAATSTPETP